MNTMPYACIPKAEIGTRGWFWMVGRKQEFCCFILFLQMQASGCPDDVRRGFST